jgi:hypothetical protein
MIAIDNRKPSNLMLLHDVQHLLDTCGRANVVDRFLRQFSSRHSERITLGGNAFDDDIPVGEHPVQPVVVTADRQCPYAQLAHALRCCH